MKRINDTSRIKNVKYLVLEGDDSIEFFNLEDVRYYVKNKPYIKYFYAFDVDNSDNFIKIRSIYMDRYTTQDVKDRLLSNQAGNYFKPNY